MRLLCVFKSGFSCSISLPEAPLAPSTICLRYAWLLLGRFGLLACWRRWGLRSSVSEVWLPTGWTFWTMSRVSGALLERTPVEGMGGVGNVVAQL